MGLGPQSGLTAPAITSGTVLEVPEPTEQAATTSNEASAEASADESTARPVRADQARSSDRASKVAPNADKLPIKMLNDRILVKLQGQEGERRSSGGILIPATAQMGKRLTWAEVVAAGPNVRAMEPGDHVLFNPEDRYEVEVRGDDYLILRERDIHAVAAQRLEESSTGLYL